MKELDVIIPVYKSKGAVRPLIDALVTWQNKSDFSLKFIFVEDGGKDGTLEELKDKLVSTSLNYSVYRLAQNHGQYTATAVGFHYSTAAFVATMDDDLQHSPELIETLFENLNKEEADLIYAV